MKIKTNCRYCLKQYEINPYLEFEFIECCSNNCKYNYFEATRSGFVPQNLRYNTRLSMYEDINLKHLVELHKKIKTELLYNQQLNEET